MKFHIGETVRIISTGEIDTIVGIVPINLHTTKSGEFQTIKLIGYKFLNSDCCPLSEEALEKVEEDNSNSTYINIDNQILFDKSEFAAAKLSDKGNTILIMNNGERHLINGNHIYEIDFKLRR